MEIGFSFYQNPVQNISVPIKITSPGLDLFILTNQISQPLFESNFRGLNEVCSELADRQTLFGTGSTSKNSHSYMNFNAAMANTVHETLKSIPIYHEVLQFKSYQCSQLISMHSSTGITNINEDELRSNKYNPSSCEWENNMGIANSIGSISQYHSTVPSLSISASHSENSLVLTEKHMNNEPDSPINRSASELFNFKEIASSNSFGSKQSISHEEKLLSPIPGYIQINSNPCSRITKFVTNCEHVDRKHYAKGLCSSCYHKGGRTKLAWNCPHMDRVLYAKGCCQECYSVLKRQRKQRQKQQSNEFRNIHGMFAMNGFY